MDRDKRSVAAMLEQVEAAATLKTMRGRLDKLAQEDFPALGCLLDLLADHPTVAGDGTTAGAVASIKRAFVRLWDDVEAAMTGA